MARGERATNVGLEIGGILLCIFLNWIKHIRYLAKGTPVIRKSTKYYIVRKGRVGRKNDSTNNFLYSYS